MSRIANLVVAFLLLMVLFMGAYLRGGLHEIEDSSASVFSSTGLGRSVAFELLSALDFKVSAWTSPPSELPRTPSLLVVSKVPKAPEHYAFVAEAAGDTQPSGASPKLERRFDPDHYRTFVEQGGTLMLSADSAHRPFLFEYFDLDLGMDPLEAEQADANQESPALEPDELSGLDERDAPLASHRLRDWFAAEESVEEPLDESSSEAPVESGASELPIPVELWVDRDAASIELLELDWSLLGALGDQPGWEVLALASGSQPVAASMPVGAGRVVLLDSDEFFDNEVIDRVQNALFVVRLAERFALDQRVLFDEYSLGGWTPASPLDLAFAPAARALTLHLLLLLTIVIWLGAWVRWFPRDPAPLAATSAKMRARGMAGLLQRHKRWELLGQMLRLGVLRRLGRRTGMGQELLEGGQELLQKPELMRAVLAPALRALSPQRQQQALALFNDATLRSRGDLNKLASELAELEMDSMQAQEPADTRLGS